MSRDSGEERKGDGETVSGRRQRHHGRQTHLRATLAVLPALVAEHRQATLLGDDTLLLLEGSPESTRGDLGVLVVPVQSTKREQTKSRQRRPANNSTGTVPAEQQRRSSSEEART